MRVAVVVNPTSGQRKGNQIAADAVRALQTHGHEVTAIPEGRTRVRQQIDQRGPVGVLVGFAMRRMTRRYLDMEAAGLKARSERLYHLDGPAS